MIYGGLKLMCEIHTHQLVVLVHQWWFLIILKLIFASSNKKVVVHKGYIQVGTYLEDEVKGRILFIVAS